ncbi:MFS transporter [Phytobacter sp. V91]|uniref:MFS transporter n=1 Tax=Phytobacter sp. V91 TaxID=3369425 RepID=UPI003F6233ED
MTQINLTPTSLTTRPLALLVPGIAQALIAVDYAIVYVALPTLAQDLHLGAGTMQWVVSLYGLTFAALLLFGGSLCDRLGARRVFSAGMALFVLASALGGLAQNGALLLLARGGQGVAAALLQPAVLALMAQRYQGEAHRRALAIWGATGALGLVAGVMLGGVLAAFNWRAIFFINLLPGLIALWRVRYDFPLIAPEGQQHSTGFGAVLGCAATGSLVWAMMRYAETGMHDFLANRLALAMLLLFILHERFAANPLWSRRLRTLPGLQSGWLSSACYMASVGSQFYAMTLLWQQTLHLDAITTGLLFTPLALLIVAGNGLFSWLSARFASARLLMGGFAAAAVGLWLISVSLSEPLSVRFILGIALSGLGHGVIYPAMFAIGLTATPVALQGRASAMIVTTQYTAGAMMLAVISVLPGLESGLEHWQSVFHVLCVPALVGVCVALCACTSKNRPL